MKLKQKICIGLFLSCLGTASWAEIIKGYEEQQIGSWIIQTRLNPLTDIAEMNAELTSVEDDEISITFRCINNKLDLYINTDYLGEDDYASVQLRLDKGTVLTEMWETANSGDAFFTPDAVRFLSKLSHKRLLAVGFKTEDYVADAVTFDLTGTADVLSLGKNVCNQ